jgi:hypothetical protein
MMKLVRLMFVFLAIGLGLSACSRLTPESYSKLEVGMPYDEVVSLMGKPAECNAVVNTKSCRWGDDKKHVDLKIIGESVIFITAKGLD